MTNKNLIIASAGIIVIIIAIIIAAVSLTSSVPKTSTTSTTSSSTTSVSASGQNSQISTSVLLTDPPIVPNGTTSLLIHYSSISIHSISSNGWISSNTQGNINLLNLTNTSVVLANLNISSNSNPNLVRFYISNASITINGTVYNVTVPSAEVTAEISNHSSVNATSSILMQFSPTIVTIYTNTTPDFILVPSVKAVVVGNVLAGKRPHEGEMLPLTKSEDRSLKYASPNITITNASISQSNNTSLISFTVTDNSNYSVNLMHASINGQENISINTSAAYMVANALTRRIDDIVSQMENNTENASINSTDKIQANENSSENNSSYKTHADINASSNTSAENSSVSSSVKISVIGKNKPIIPATNQRILSTFKTGVEIGKFNNFNTEFSDRLESVMGGLTGNSTIGAFVSNAITNGTLNTTSFRNELSNKINVFLSQRYNENEAFQNHNRVIQFQISGNGTLQLPFSEDQFANNLGYTLKPGQSHTFTFIGRMTLANGRMQISMIPGENYTLNIQGDMGARAEANLTAK